MLTTAAVAVGVGVGVAALAGLGLAGAALGAGTLLAANSSFAQRAKPPLQPADVRRDEQGCIGNWTQLLKAVQHGVSTWRCTAWAGARLLPAGRPSPQSSPACRLGRVAPDPHSSSFLQEVSC